MILKNENDIYIYFETIEQLEPQSILDAGMFLKRIGSVARKVMGCEVLPDIRLDGIDFFPERTFPVWKQIYDSIVSIPSFLEGKSLKRYDLAVFLGTEELCKMQGFTEVLIKAAESASYLLADQRLEPWSKNLPQHRIKELNLEEQLYFLFDFGA